jgi:hypothetical protein
LIIISLLFLIILGFIFYLYFNLKKVPEKTYSQESPSVTNTKASSDFLEEKNLVDYENKNWEFSLKYPAAWGEVTSEKTIDREIFKLGLGSDFMVTVRQNPVSSTGEEINAKTLAQEGTEDGCSRWETEANTGQQVFRVSCPGTEKAWEKAYLQSSSLIYILTYQYHAQEINPEETEETLNLVFDSFELL